MVPTCMLDNKVGLSLSLLTWKYSSIKMPKNTTKSYVDVGELYFALLAGKEKKKKERLMSGLSDMNLSPLANPTLLKNLLGAR